MFSGFSRSVMGASHEVSGIVCQDSSSHKICEDYAVAVVADGHGSKKHFRSNIGSSFAVEATLETIEKFYRSSDDFEKIFAANHQFIIKKIEKQIIALWNNKIIAHLAANPVTDEEKSKFSPEEFENINPVSYYGTTLVAAVTCKSFTFGIQIGDGSLVTVLNDGTAIMPMEYEESAPANITASLCNSSASSMFNSFFFEDKKVIALYGSTDGLYTSFGSEYDFLDYHTLITSQLAEDEQFTNVIFKNLVKRTHFGTQDDISLSCVFNKDYAKELLPVLKEKVEQNNRTIKARRTGRFSG